MPVKAFYAEERGTSKAVSANRMIPVFTNTLEGINRDSGLRHS